MNTFYLGIDVAKAKVDCALLRPMTSGDRRSSPIPSWLSALADWLEAQGATTCMSAWKPPASTGRKLLSSW